MSEKNDQSSLFNDAALTPLMRQYLAIKQQNPEALLLFRMGDFYELFNEDAQVASRILGLTLTCRNSASADATPLAGFPYHALDRYATKLVKAGYKIAICEQVEDPKTAKGIVKRDIIEIISAGTATDDGFIDEKTNNYIVSLHSKEPQAGLAICDLSTGEFWCEEIDATKLEEEIARLDPSEVVIADTPENPMVARLDSYEKKMVVSRFDDLHFNVEMAQTLLVQHFNLLTLSGLGFEGFTVGIAAAGALLAYLKDQKKNDLKHITSLKRRTIAEFAELDPSSIRNLELLRPLHTDQTDGTLIWVLDRTCTAMGARQLKRWITHPLANADAINERLDKVAWLKKDIFTRGELELLLKRVADMERLVGRVMTERAHGRDVLGLKNSLETFPRIVKLLEVAPSLLCESISSQLSGMDFLAEKIGATIVDSPPQAVREGGLIRKGISPPLDEFRDAMHNGKQWIATLQETERIRTGISTLKVGYNKVFGYYIEISKSNVPNAPEDYIRKQTLTNGERYITPALKEMEEKILGAEEKMVALEYDIFVALRKEIAEQCVKLQKAGQAIAELDVLTALGRVAADYGYCRPEILDTHDLIIREGRHPVVERMNASEKFVPNDTLLKEDDTQILLITGPNMAGKSTYLRQNSLIALMAQMGSFVPAAQAQIGLVDKFFTRVGAADRLAQGQSTFLVEMIEVASILNNATEKSLVILDEVGRGTSTFDGISIAWAVAEYLHDTPHCRPRTFFATHYHELTELPMLFPRVKNAHVKVKEWNDRIIFLRKIEEGSCDHSYGIQVARLAGVPRPVIIRAKEILANLEKMELTPDAQPALAQRAGPQLGARPVVQTDLFAQRNAVAIQEPTPENNAAREFIELVEKVDVHSMTPLQAMVFLDTLVVKAKTVTALN